MILPQSALPNHQHVMASFLQACQSDSRIQAATLYGSYARGTADQWSDLDIGVIIADVAYDDFIAGRESFIHRLGEPLFIEDFDIPGVLFFILADGTEGELAIDRAGDFTEPYIPWRALIDKTGVLAEAKHRSEPDPAEGIETLRRQITWFWHDLSHFITAVERGQLWWAAGQLEVLRRCCMNVARLRRDLNDEGVGDDPYFKADKALPAESLAPLKVTFAPLERTALIAAAGKAVDFFREVTLPMAEEYGIPYPFQLERLMLERMWKLADT